MPVLPANGLVWTAPKEMLLVHCSLWHFAAGTPGHNHFRHLTPKQEDWEPDLASTDLYKKRALVLANILTLLKGVI
jgi:hypothetical protein